MKHVGTYAGEHGAICVVERFEERMLPDGRIPGHWKEVTLFVHPLGQVMETFYVAATILDTDRSSPAPGSVVEIYPETLRSGRKVWRFKVRS